MKAIKLITVLLLVFTLSVSAVSANILQTVNANETTQPTTRPTFSDVPSNYWAKSSIDAAVKKGYVNGYADGTFKPEKAITRAEFIKMAVDALGIKTTSTVKSPWYAPYTDAAKKAGILKDTYAENEYNSGLPRNEMAKIAVLSAGVKPWSLLQSQEYGVINEAQSLGEYMFLAVQNGIIQGLGNGKVGAKETTTRAQAITIIERILTLKSGKKLTPADKYTQSNAEFEWNRSNILTHFAPYITKNFTTFGSKGYVLEDKNKNKYKAELMKLTVIDLVARKTH